MSGAIKRVAVIGAGVMGAQIAAHLSNVGCQVDLFDIVPDGATDPSILAKKGIEAVVKANPPAFYLASSVKRITPRNLRDDCPSLATCDWVIEVVVENVAIKRKVYSAILPHISANAVISSNTSGIPLATLIEGMDPHIASRMMITHFFNPVRYMKLVEVIAHSTSDMKQVERIERFLRDEMGKGVVRAKDTPNFIANRIGVFSVMSAMWDVANGGATVEAIDAVMGKTLGRAKSAIFRTADVVGLDTLAHVSTNSYQVCVTDKGRETFQLPPFFETMIANRQLGAKTGGGFYKKVKVDGKSEIHVLNPVDGTYQPASKWGAASLKAAKKMEIEEAIRSVVWADDDAGQIAWRLISRELVYAANRLGEIADKVEDVDAAMRWGFGWERGPFELWDILGVEKIVKRLEEEKRDVPASARKIIDSGRLSFYAETPPFVKKRTGKTLVSTESADLFELGDGVLCCEFHGKMNAVDGDLVATLNRGIDEVEKGYEGLVVTGRGDLFSAGANLMLVWMAAQAGDWKQIDEMIVAFQQLTSRMRRSPKPLVAAVSGLALGGGCEMLMASPRVCAAAESYMGLVEAGVGVIPAGGGCLNLLVRMNEIEKHQRGMKEPIWMSPLNGGPFPMVKGAFERIGLAKVSSSAPDAKQIGYLRSTDRVVLDQAKVLDEAKKELLAMVGEGYQPAGPVSLILPGRGGMMSLINAVKDMDARGLVTPHDIVVTEKLAYVLAGGNRATAYLASDHDILDLEREAFLSLCGMEATQARMQHMLMTGKPLRN